MLITKFKINKSVIFVFRTRHAYLLTLAEKFIFASID